MIPIWSLVPTVMSGCDAMVGAVVSSTVIRKAPLFVFPLRSLALQFTVFVPRGKIEPEGDRHVTGTFPSIASVADTE